MNFLPPEIERYAESISSPESGVLKKLNRDTHAKVLRPRMLSGHLQGNLLELISCMIRPSRILEVGTYTGYSAICMARGLKAGGRLHTIDHNPELEDFAREYFVRAGLQNSIVQHIGEALDLIPTLDETFDLAFIDADKENYITYFDMIYEKTSSGGVILADNVLWSGKVLQKDAGNDPETEGIVRFNEYVKNHSGIRNLLLPFRDGLMISQKI